MPYANDNQMTGYNRLRMQQRQGPREMGGPQTGRMQMALPQGDEARFGQMYAGMMGSIMDVIRRRRQPGMAGPAPAQQQAVNGAWPPSPWGM